MTAAGAKQAAIIEVLHAWRDAGPAPFIHEAAKRRLHRDWPTLWRTLNYLDKVCGEIE